MSSTRLNPTYGLGWVRLDLCDGLGWVEFFFTHHGELTHMGWVEFFLTHHGGLG